MDNYIFLTNNKYTLTGEATNFDWAGPQNRKICGIVWWRFSVM